MPVNKWQWFVNFRSININFRSENVNRGIGWVINWQTCITWEWQVYYRDKYLREAWHGMHGHANAHFFDVIAEDTVSRRTHTWRGDMGAPYAPMSLIPSESKAIWVLIPYSGNFRHLIPYSGNVSKWTIPCMLYDNILLHYKYVWVHRTEHFAICKIS